VLAINGWSLKARTLQDVTDMIAMSRRHLTLRIEFDVAGHCFILLFYVVYLCIQSFHSFTHSFILSDSAVFKWHLKIVLISPHMGVVTDSMLILIISIVILYEVFLVC